MPASRCARGVASDAVLELVSTLVPRRAPLLVAVADVERAVERDAVGADRAVVGGRVQPGVEARPAVRLRAAAAAFLVGRSAAWARLARPTVARRTNPSLFMTAPRVESIEVKLLSRPIDSVQIMRQARPGGMRRARFERELDVMKPNLAGREGFAQE